MENSESKNKIVKTYAEDMTEVLENDKTGLIKKIIHGEEEHEKEKRNFSPESARNKFFMFFGSLLIITSFVTLFFFLIKREVPSIPIPKQFVPIIFTDKSALIEISGLDKDKIPGKILDEVRAEDWKEKGIIGIYPTIDKASIGLGKFNELIGSSFTGAGSAFIEDNFLLGAYKEEGRKDLFILIKMRSIPDIFGAMNSWEGKMFLELHSFFEVQLTPETKYLLTKSFEDGIVQNRNARILYDNARKPVIMYIYADDNSVVITNTLAAGNEVTIRLNSSKVGK